jgi:hypothetical protein
MHARRACTWVRRKRWLALGTACITQQMTVQDPQHHGVRYVLHPHLHCDGCVGLSSVCTGGPPWMPAAFHRASVLVHSGLQLCVVITPLLSSCTLAPLTARPSLVLLIVTISLFCLTLSPQSCRSLRRRSPWWFSLGSTTCPCSWRLARHTYFISCLTLHYLCLTLLPHFRRSLRRRSPWWSSLASTT